MSMICRLLYEIILLFYTQYHEELESRGIHDPDTNHVHVLVPFEAMGRAPLQ